MVTLVRQAAPAFTLPLLVVASRSAGGRSRIGGGRCTPRPAGRPDLADCRGLASTASDKDSLIHFSNPPLRSGSAQPPSSSAAFLPPLTTSSPSVVFSPGPGRHGKGQRQAPPPHMDGALLLASLVWSAHLALTCRPFHLSYLLALSFVFNNYCFIMN